MNDFFSAARKKLEGMTLLVVVFTGQISRFFMMYWVATEVLGKAFNQNIQGKMAYDWLKLT